MKTYELLESNATEDLVKAVYQSDEPLIAAKEGDECLIVMTPEVFERILFENSQLAEHDRALLHL